MKVGMALGVLVGILVCATVQACNIPVFRYALERWAADKYELIVFHRGTLAEDKRAVIAALEKRAADPTAPANLEVVLVDLDGKPSKVMQELFEQQRKPELPAAVLRYPPGSNFETAAWTGRLAEIDASSLIDSPARRQIAKRLLAGDSAVWLFLTSGNAEKDAAARKTLEAQVPELHKTLKLPELTNDPADRLAREELPLKLAFAIVEVARADPAERLLVASLLQVEPDLAERSEPMVFPIFGRGRVLEPMLGAGITGDNLLSAGSFLVGACSCKVKRLNPGVDLLIAADWEPVASGEPAEVPAKEPAEAEPVPIAPGIPASRPDLDGLGEEHVFQFAVPRVGLWAGIAAAVVAVLVTGILVARSARMR